MHTALERSNGADVDFLHDFVVGGSLSKYLSSLLGNQIMFSNCLRQASLHENGFLKVPIELPQLNDRRARIHFWPNAATAQNIHDHRFDFTSIVLKGSVENFVWVRSEGGEKYYKFKYQNDAKGRRMIFVGQKELKVASKERFGVLHCYQVPQDQLHTISHSPSTVTMIIEDRRNLKPFANVYRKVRQQPTQTPPIPVRADVLRRNLKGLIL